MAANHTCAYPYVSPAAPGPDTNELTEVYVAIIVIASTMPFIFLPPIKYCSSEDDFDRFSALLLYTKLIIILNIRYPRKTVSIIF